MRSMIPALFLLISVLPATRLSAEDLSMDESRLPDLGELWNFNDPAGTRTRFQELLPDAEKSGDRSYHLQVLTQIARTHSLEAHFDEAIEMLDRVDRAIESAEREEPESAGGDRFTLVRVRSLLERGRTLNSSGDKAGALPLFRDSYAMARKNGLDFFAVDAAHMVAIAEKGPDEKRRWNMVGIEVAEASSEPRARGWLGSLYNNMGWDYHDGSEYEKALDMFQKALVERKEKGDPESIGIARWSIARSYRSLERIDEALEIQLDLFDRSEKSGNDDGYVYEELGELYLLNGEEKKAAPFFARAHEVLSEDVWLQRNEAERLTRLLKLGADDSR